MVIAGGVGQGRAVAAGREGEWAGKGLQCVGMAVSAALRQKQLIPSLRPPPSCCWYAFQQATMNCECAGQSKNHCPSGAGTRLCILVFPARLLLVLLRLLILHIAQVLKIRQEALRQRRHGWLLRCQAIGYWQLRKGAPAAGAAVAGQSGGGSGEVHSSRGAAGVRQPTTGFARSTHGCCQALQQQHTGAQSGTAGGIGRGRSAHLRGDPAAVELLALRHAS